MLAEVPLPLVSVIVPVYRGLDVLPQQLVSLARQDYKGEWEVILSDNEGVKDVLGSFLSTVEQRPPNVIVVDSSARQGNAAARNIGAEYANGQLLLFCDQDDRVPSDWISRLVAGLVECEVAVGTFQLSGSAQVNANFKGPYNFLPYGLSASMGVRRETFQNLAGFDETFASATDLDLCWRAQVSGLRLHCDPRNVTWKRRKATARDAWRQRVSFGRDDVLLYRRYRPHGLRFDGKEVFKTYVWLLRRAPTALLGRDEDGTWVRLAGQRWGRAQGSLAARTLYL